MPEKDNCPVCTEEIQHPTTTLYEVNGTQIRALYLKCRRCGDYCLTNGLKMKLEQAHKTNTITLADFAKISSKLRENSEPILLEPKNVKEWATIKMPSFHEKADKLLLELDKRTLYAGGEISLSDSSLISIAWAIHGNELKEILRYLAQEGRIEKKSYLDGTAAGSLTFIDFAGWAHLEKLKETNAASAQGFIAMRFKDEFNPLKEAIVGAIGDAGYDAKRVDDVKHVGKIDDEIMLQIRRSRFVVADFTEQNQGVYYEAGFARGLGLQVFCTCLKEEIEGSKLHFDTRQYIHIPWDVGSEDKLRGDLAKHIEAVLGKGPNKPL